MIPIKKRYSETEKLYYIYRVLLIVSRKQRYSLDRLAADIQYTIDKLPAGTDLRQLNNLVSQYQNEFREKSLIAAWLVMPCRQLKIIADAISRGTLLRKCVKKSKFFDLKNVYDTFSKENYQLNTWIVEKTGQRVCPYCNINYVYCRGKKATAQIDHFYPRAYYPQLALCLYNLVPICSACNQLKLDSLKKLQSPFDENFRKDMTVGVSLQNVSNNAGIRFIPTVYASKSSAEAKNMIDLLRLNDAYQKHEEEATRFLYRAMYYESEDGAKAIRKMASSMGISNIDAINVFLDTNILGDSHGKISLGKMRHDLLALVRKSNRGAK